MIQKNSIRILIPFLFPIILNVAYPSPTVYKTKGYLNNGMEKILSANCLHPIYDSLPPPDYPKKYAVYESDPKKDGLWCSVFENTEGIITFMEYEKIKNIDGDKIKDGRLNDMAKNKGKIKRKANALVLVKGNMNKVVEIGSVTFMMKEYPGGTSIGLQIKGKFRWILVGWKKNISIDLLPGEYFYCIKGWYGKPIMSGWVRIINKQNTKVYYYAKSFCLRNERNKKVIDVGIL